MTTLPEHLAAAHLRAAAVRAEIEHTQNRGFADGGTGSLLASLRIKLVETERLIAILSDSELLAHASVATPSELGELAQVRVIHPHHSSQRLYGVLRQPSRDKALPGMRGVIMNDSGQLWWVPEDRVQQGWE